MTKPVEAAEDHVTYHMVQSGPQAIDLKQSHVISPSIILKRIMMTFATQR